MKKNDLRPHNRQGFTLIEILLTVMIVAFLAGSLYATFAAGLKLEKRTKQSFQDLDDSRMIMEQFNKDLGRAAYYDFRGSFPDRKCFTADGTKLVFLINDNDELKWVRYSLQVADKGQVKGTQLGIVTSRNVAVSNVTTSKSGLLTLVRDENDFIHSFDLSDAPQHREILNERVPYQGLELLFSATTGAQTKIEWKSNWDEVFLPSAVRLSVSVQSQGGPIKKFTRDVLLPAGGHDVP